MRRILWILLASVIVVGVAWAFASLPGRVHVEIGDLTIETATSVAMVLLLTLFVILYVGIRVLATLIHLPGITGRWRADRQRRAGDSAVTRALLALAAGTESDARREAHRARKLLGDTPQTLLLAAEAGRLAGRDDEAEAAFRALAAKQDAALLGFRGLYRLAVARDDWAEAATLAGEAERSHPGAAWLRPERSRLAIRSGNWADALALAAPGPQRAALATAAALRETDPSKAARLATQAWKEDPGLVPAVVAYAESLRASGREKRAQTVLHHAWATAPHPDIAASALKPYADKLERARQAQHLADANPEHPESRLLLASTALEAGLTGEARHQAETALAMGLNQRRLWLLLAEIEEAEHGASDASRTALRRAADADPDPAWCCSNCHSSYARWAGACPNCFTPGSLRWTTSVMALPAITSD